MVFKTFLMGISHLLQCRITYSNYYPLSFEVHRRVEYFEYPLPLEVLGLKYRIDGGVIVQFVIGSRSLVKALTLCGT